MLCVYEKDTKMAMHTFKIGSSMMGWKRRKGKEGGDINIMRGYKLNSLQSIYTPKLRMKE